MNYYSRGTFGASAPLPSKASAESVTIYYKVKAGTIAWRWIAAAPGPNPSYESFITSRDVEYGPEDLCKESFDRKPNSEVKQWYVFILPPEAAPWDRFKVSVNDVKEVV